jgi:hypothetical protein
LFFLSPLIVWHGIPRLFHVRDTVCVSKKKKKTKSEIFVPVVFHLATIEVAFLVVSVERTIKLIFWLSTTIELAFLVCAKIEFAFLV